MKRRGLHWAWRVGIAATIATVYGGFAVTSCEKPHEWLAKKITDVLYDGHFRRGVPGALAYFAPVVLISYAVFGILTRYFVPPTVQDEETRCRNCRYILRGITEPRCPECGERI